MPNFIAPFFQAVPAGLWVGLLAFAGVLAVLVGVLAFARRADEIAQVRVTPPAPAAAPRAVDPPVLRDEVAAPPAPEPRPPAAPPRPLLLVADDSAVARAKLRRLFEGAGYEVDLVEDGAQALEKVAARPYAVLVTDLEMPVLDGLQLIAHVQGSLETEDLPIIAITGHESLSARVQDVQGVFGLFRKPWNDRELLRRVAAVAALRGATAPA